MVKARDLFAVWKTVFGNWKYLFGTLFVALLFFLLNVLILNWSNISAFYPVFGFFGSAKFFFLLARGFGGTVLLHSFVSLIMISFLFGMLFSLVWYKMSANIPRGNKSYGLLGGIGVFLGTLVPGCAACGIGLASTLGLSAGILTLLPYNGLEISILSIGLLSFVIIRISKDMMVCDGCLVKLNAHELKGGEK